MPLTHVALFRGVNVGGHGLLGMADLRAMLEDLDLGSPRTLLQSGNALFDAGRRAAGQLESMIEQELHRRRSLNIDVVVRSAREWRDVIAANPFAAHAKENPARLALVALKSRPAASAVRTLERSIVGSEEIEAVDRHLFIVYPDGMGRSKLTGTLIEKVLGTRGTARNWNTVLRIEAAFRTSRP